MENLNNEYIESKAVLSKSLITVMAIACGLTVANLYYIQPLLADMAKTFNVSEISVGSAAMMIILMFALRKIIPVSKPASDIKYFDLLKSLFRLIRTESVLREASINGAMMFAAFSAFWTSLTFLLESSHYNMRSQICL